MIARSILLALYLAANSNVSFAQSTDEEKAFNAAYNLDTAQAYADYLAKFPDGSKIKFATSFFRARTQADEALRDGSPDALRAFLKQYRDSRYALEVKQKLMDVEGIVRILSITTSNNPQREMRRTWTTLSIGQLDSPSVTMTPQRPSEPQRLIPLPKESVFLLVDVKTNPGPVQYDGRLNEDIYLSSSKGQKILGRLWIDPSSGNEPGWSDLSETLINFDRERNLGLLFIVPKSEAKNTVLNFQGREYQVAKYIVK